MGLITAPPVGGVGVVPSHEADGGMVSLPLSAHQCSELMFTIELTDGVQVRWQCSMRDNNLYVHVPDNLPQYGSKDSFVALLEYAETDLHVSHIIVRLSKTQPDISAVIRLFMFFGFSALPSTHSLLSLLPSQHCVCLAYTASSE